MKKLLLNATLAAAMAVPAMSAQDLKIETKWVFGVEDMVASPVPGLDGNWSGTQTTNPAYNADATCSRFGVGKDGKIITTDHTRNALIAFDNHGVSLYATIPSRVDGKWNGTAVSTDDAGNVIFNYCFTSAQKSSQEWGVLDANGTITNVTLSTPLSEVGIESRLDIISHIIGDVTSEEGGIGYATLQNSGKVIMFHFKGDGTKVTSLTAKANPETLDMLAALATDSQLAVPTPKYFTVAETLAKNPEQQFYLPLGKLNSQDLLDGFMVNYENGYLSPLFGFGNRGYLTVNKFKLGGEEYIVRNYVADSNPDAEVLNGWINVMQYGIFDMQGKCVATWTGSQYSNGFGMGTITVEQVDDNTVNVYPFVATGSAHASTATEPGIYGAMFTVSLTS